MCDCLEGFGGKHCEDTPCDKGMFIFIVPFNGPYVNLNLRSM